MENTLENLTKKCNIELIMLFGSQAKNTAHAKSDTDIAVVAGRSLTLEEISSLTMVLAQTYDFAEDTIDLIEIIKASPLLQFEIAQSGKLLWGNEAKLARFKILAWRRYQDTAKLRKWREENLKKIYAQ